MRTGKATVTPLLHFFRHKTGSRPFPTWKEMVNNMRKLAIIALSLATGLAATAPVYAAPVMPSMHEQNSVNPNIVKVDDDWHHRHHDDHHHHHGNAAAIVGGLAAGAIIGGAISNQQRHDEYQRERYYDNDRRYYDHRYYEDDNY
jgi:hypothetical protein